MPAIHPFTSDAPLFYNVGVWGQRGYAVPNWGQNESGQTVNATIERFVTEGGRRLSIIMHHPDADRVDPPSLNTVSKIVAFINRARVLIVGRAVAENAMKFEGSKVRSRRMPLKVFPFPYFKVDNRLMADFATSALACLAELLQSTENGIEHDITEQLSEIALRYVARYQRDLAMDYFGMTKSEAEAPELNLATMLEKYKPTANGYIPGEAYDDTGTLSWPQETELGVLAKGILIMDLPPLGPYPYNDTIGSSAATASVAGVKTAQTAAVPAFPQNAAYNLS